MVNILLCIMYVLLLLLVPLWLCYYLYQSWRSKRCVAGLHKKCVMVTGCDTGFGRATAISLYKRGVHVFAACYTEECARTLREETGDTLLTILLDLSSSQSISHTYKFVRNKLPPNSVFWGLVNNAGTAARHGPLECWERDTMRRLLEVNCLGMIELTKTFLPLLKISRGRIVITSSIAGQLPYLTSYYYTISKYASRAFSEQIRFHLGLWGIHVSTVIPGSFRTGMNRPRDRETSFQAIWDSMDPETQQEYGKDYVEQVLDSHKWLVTDRAQTDLQPVIEAYEHALFACHPQDRYIVGRDAKFFNFINDYCPWFVWNMVGRYIVNRTVPRVVMERI